MKRLVMALLAAAILTAPAAVAQESSYIQIEAQPSLTRAEDRVRDYASYLRDVNGFALDTGWYGVALGPYGPNEAESRLRQLRAQGQIPPDSFIAETSTFRRQFWPVGPSALASRQTTADPAPEPAAQRPSDDGPAANDETPRQAAASEARLNRSERERLQVALRWAGFYDDAIDGAFGRGTRNSMAGWQQANGYDVTGILTTRQRGVLLDRYDAVLDGLDLRQVTESRAGISMRLPMAVVAFEKYESPFVHYGPTGDLPVRVLMISEPGDQTTLFGLYEIMQTLEIVPLEGPRDRRSNGFSLTGINDRIVSHTEVRLEAGQIKGFTLIWPAGDEARRTRVLDEMRRSFERIPGVLERSATTDTGPSVDLLSGLEIRRPRLTASGFYIDGSGTVITARNAVSNCGRITIEDQYDARVVAQDEVTGVAVLRSDTPLAPQSVAAFRNDVPRLQSEIAVSGYSFGGILSAPTLTFGTLEDLRGLSGEQNLKRLALASLPGDAGGPVLDAGGAVLGMLLPREDGNRQLPEEVSFAAKSEDIQGFLRRSGLAVTATEGDVAMAPEDLSAVAAGMTVLVSCWE